MLSLAWLPQEKSLTASASSLALIKKPVRSFENKFSSIYTELNLQEKGLSQEAFDYASYGYSQLLDHGRLTKNYLTICDMSQSSRQQRLYLIDMESHSLVLTTYVAHGKNSGGEYASRFSNRAESLQSSLGFYITNNTYFGEHGLSLRVTGLERGFNDNANHRAIVVHGAKYIGNGLTGRSFGCPAVPAKESQKIIEIIKNGTCLFIYHPSRNYLAGSKILND
jgi:hypothetical protein